MSRNFPSRIKFAGTYDDKWKDERFPFLPQDFDEQYFLSAPVDLSDEEVLRINHVTQVIQPSRDVRPEPPLAQRKAA